MTQREWDKIVEQIKKDLAAENERKRAEEAARQKENQRIKDALGK